MMEQTRAQSEKWSEELSPSQVAFLSAYIVVGMVGRACEVAEIGRTTLYRWKKEDERFAAAMEIAEELAAENAEDEAIRRATHGLRKYKFTKDGSPIKHPITGEFYFEHEYSDNLLMFVLKAKKPDKYKDRVQNEHSGQVSVKHIILEDRPSGDPNSRSNDDDNAPRAGDGAG